MIKTFIKKIAHKFPTTLPVGTPEFEAFYKDICDTHGYPDKPGYKKLIATLIQHTKEDKVKIPKAWFAKAIKKAQANETAYWMIKAADEEMAAEEKKQKSEATNVQEIKPVESPPPDCA